MNPLLMSAMLFGAIARAQEPAEAPEITPEKAKSQSSLALGYRDGTEAFLKQLRAEDLDTAAFLEGFLLGLEGKPLTLESEEVREAMARLQAKITTRERELATTNKAKEEQFLRANVTAEGITQTESGLQYRIVEAGEGDPVGLENLPGCELSVSYRGSLPDGREFIASAEGSPEKIKVDETIPGFREAISLMPKGAKWVVFVPASLAYGDQRHSGMIGPNQLVIFEIELVDFKLKATQE